MPDLLAARSKVAPNGLADLNIELGLLNKRTFNSNSTGLASGGSIAGGTIGSGGLGVIGGVVHEPPPCFLGKTLFTLADRTQIPFSELYENKDKYKHCLSFTKDDRAVQGDILDVFKRTVYQYLIVTFDDGVSSVVAEHRYYVPEGKYIPIKDLRGKFVMDENDGFIRVEKYIRIFVPKGISVYNASIDLKNYCADKKRVHNRKREGPEF